MPHIDQWAKASERMHMHPPSLLQQARDTLWHIACNQRHLPFSALAPEIKLRVGTVLASLDKVFSECKDVLEKRHAREFDTADGNSRRPLVDFSEPTPGEIWERMVSAVDGAARELDDVYSRLKP